ncbi:helix-turn-helix transcriptional regulator [Paenibacillus barcinonensis]|uniref:helix-turn-helix domain-containing protein n=1 Tax=Paenibacillus barcinonensis TaxID=198119 RepID=UPI001C10C9F7|nr:helix-turn-helix transcriptional regulator [Paenibacillus barcinonensis]MBU5356165.1 helix-turn-helix transcriptional regulator [Paenibacillus barcinonensis]
MSTIIVELFSINVYDVFEVITMIRLKLNELMDERGLNPRQVSNMTGIRWNTVSDMAENKSKAWSPENLSKIMMALELTDISQLIEYKKEQQG